MSESLAARVLGNVVTGDVEGLIVEGTGMGQIGVTTSGDGGMTLSNTASTPRTKVQA
jgi:hypothetical protein